MKSMKKNAKGFVIVVVFLALCYSLVNQLVVQPFQEGYVKHGIAGGLLSTVIMLLIAGGLFSLISWALKD
jgi:hypothetical protein